MRTSLKLALGTCLLVLLAGHSISEDRTQEKDKAGALDKKPPLELTLRSEFVARGEVNR